MNHELPIERAYDYMLGGKAELVFFNKTKNTSVVFNINKQHPGIWYVYYQTIYIGFIRGDLFHPAKDIAEETIHIFKRILSIVVNKYTHPDLAIMHTGICSVCSRKLTDPESIEWGIGPECRKKLFLTPLKPEQHAHETDNALAETRSVTSEGDFIKSPDKEQENQKKKRSSEHTTNPFE